MRSRFLDEVPADLTDAEEPRVRPGLRPGSWSAAAAGTAALASEGVGQGLRGDGGSSFRTGDDVNHAAFGEGVITGVEPGGIVVVRFASDGSERKLMADYAPITKR
jgi:DNA helicase-2/ATP-dependent DNA helicase PcrA